jgi:hypothetical protein
MRHPAFGEGGVEIFIRRPVEADDNDGPIREVFSKVVFS